MLSPVGDLPPRVYWVRRLMLALVLLLLVLLLVVVIGLFVGGSDDRQAGTGATTPSASKTTPVTSSQSTGSSPSPSATPSPTPSSTPSSGPVACVAASLQIGATTSAPSYPTGATVPLFLTVTNPGPAVCMADLADPQIELRVYNGNARVWGSHDCQIEPGSTSEGLPVGQQIRREIDWSGLSSSPGCAGTRLRVGIGSYTLIPFLAGVQGAPASFAIT